MLSRRSIAHVIAAAVILCLVGCDERHTVSPAEAARSKPGRSYATPIYTEAIDVVQRAAVRACMGYYHHVDENDHVAHRIFVKNRTVWVGSSDVTITLATNDAGRTVVNIASEGVNAQVMSASGRTERDLEEIIKRLADEMAMATAYEAKPTGG